MTPSRTLQPLYLVFAADDRFAMPLCVAVTSALAHVDPQREVSVWIFDGGIRDRSKGRIERCVRRVRPMTELHWVAPSPEWLPRLPEDSYGSSNYNSNNFLRLGIPYVLPDNCDRAVYLDADTVVLADLSELVAQISEDHTVVAVRDYGCATFETARLTPREGAPAEVAYFNSGVMGLNLARWRSLKVSKQVIDLVETRTDLRRFADQDALNVVLEENWSELDLSWNLQTGGPDRIRWRGYDERQVLGELFSSIVARRKIVHYTGDRPWVPSRIGRGDRSYFVWLGRSGWFSTGQLLVFRMNHHVRSTSTMARMVAQSLKRRVAAVFA